MKAYNIRVAGLVQGVGYRWFVQNEARRLGISGWVRNMNGGDVEIAAEGEEKDLKTFIERLEKGHQWAQVESVTAGSMPASGAQEFSIRH